MKILYIEIDEEITSIIDKIKLSKDINIYLCIPSKSCLFNSIVNLRILKHINDKYKKNIVIQTKDKKGKTLALKSGFKVVSKISPPKKNKNSVIYITPIQAKTNIYDKSKPYVRRDKKINLNDILDNKTKSSDTSNQIPNYSLPKPSIKLIIVLLLVSISLFLFIIYLALPGATVYIKPKSEILEQALIVHLLNNIQTKTLNKLSIESYPLETVVEKNMNIQTTNEQFFGSPSKGIMKVINTTTKDMALKGNTQFVSRDGIIFRTQNWINVPAKKGEINGEILVDVIADPFDINGQRVGERGNIEPQVFQIRLFDQHTQKLIWGESINIMEGGTSVYKKILTQNELDKAKNDIKKILIDQGKKKLYDLLKEKNLFSNSNLRMLDDSDYTSIDIIELNVNEDLIDKEIDEFSIYCKLRIKTLAFDINELKKILIKELKFKTNTDMRLREDLFDENYITYKVVDTTKDYVKMSITVKGIQEYIIEPDLPSGKRLSQNIKNKIAGKSLLEADNIVSNLPQVAEVEISVWPFWTSAIPQVHDNITIKLKK